MPRDSKFPRPGCEPDALILMNFIRVPSPGALRRHSCRRHALTFRIVRHACMATSLCWARTPWPCVSPPRLRHVAQPGGGPAKVLLTQGPGHAATLDAMLDLFLGDRA